MEGVLKREVRTCLEPSPLFFIEITIMPRLHLHKTDKRFSPEFYRQAREFAEEKIAGIYSVESNGGVTLPYKVPYDSRGLPIKEGCLFVENNLEALSKILTSKHPEKWRTLQVYDNSGVEYKFDCDREGLLGLVDSSCNYSLCNALTASSTLESGERI